MRLQAYEVTGLLCEPDDAVSLTKKIQLLMLNNELRKELCKNAISKVRAEFELNENVMLLEKKLSE